MKKRLLYTLFCFVPFIAKGQGENNIWTFSAESGASGTVVNFNTSPPSLLALPNPYIQEFGWACAVSYPNGQLRFVFGAKSNLPGNTYPLVFHPDGSPIANSDLLTGFATEGLMPVVVPRPGNPDQYYLIYSYSKGLVYSLLDMSLNNGAGAIVDGQKDIVFAPYGTVIPMRLCAVPGCDGIWIVTHSRINNEYLSYHITASGIDTNNVVVSPVGNFDLYDYGFLIQPQRIKASDDGSMLAVSTWKGIEMYDFEKCSGRLKNARILDTTGNTLPHPQSIYHNHNFSDVCFSPDGTKIYATANEINSSIEGGIAGKLYQYNIAQPTWGDVVLSKTLILTNQPSIIPLVTQCIKVVENPLGEMKCGPDGKLYIDNGSYTCLYPEDVPDGYNPGAAFHTLDFPNLAGMACQPHYNTLVVNGFNGQLERSFAGAGFGRSMLQQNIVVAPPKPDTIIGYVYDSAACFTNILTLQADSTASCYEWDNGSTDRNRTVNESGTYFVHYFKDCSYSTDTFHVRFVKVPYIGIIHQNCPGLSIGTIAAYYQDSEADPMEYTWRSADSIILQHHTTINGDTLSGLDSGTYYVEVTNTWGCDTTLSITVENMPKPEISSTPTDTTIRYGDTIMLNASGTVSFLWQPDSFVTSGANTASPFVRPLHSTVFSVIGINQYGCQDTSWVHVDIDYNMPVLLPNAFSPNGDGKNDVFKIEGFTYQQIKQFYIFNRFGEVIFTTKDGNNGWDGTQNGKPCDMGTYYYLIKIDFPDGSSKTYKGDIALIR